MRTNVLAVVSHIVATALGAIITYASIALPDIILKATHAFHNFIWPKFAIILGTKISN